MITVGCSGRVGGAGGEADGSPVFTADADPRDPDAAASIDGAALADATAPATRDPGQSCGCDSECKGSGAHSGVCVHGVCMLRASGPCASGGSQGECPDGSRCWGIAGAEGNLCWPDCDSVSCDGACDSDGSCAPEPEQTQCNYACGSYCACAPGDCALGLECVGGSCVPTSQGPGQGPGPSCPDLPERDCTSSCGELVHFDPRTTAHYDDYPINGETATNQYRSYMRRDLMMLLDYATAKTHCKSAGWSAGIGGALGMGDASEINGSIPGTSDGDPDHPSGSHLNGRDIDVAYYQIGTPDNRLRAVCEHVSWGENQYRCVGEPDRLDVWRTAMFFGALFESSRVRVIGVDGKAGPYIVAAVSELCETGWIEPSACDRVNLAYETTNTGLGWFYHHHHHNHISLKSSSVAPVGDRVMACRVPGCDAPKRKPNPLWPRAPRR